MAKERLREEVTAALSLSLKPITLSNLPLLSQHQKKVLLAKDLELQLAVAKQNQAVQGSKLWQERCELLDAKCAAAMEAETKARSEVSRAKR